MNKHRNPKGAVERLYARLLETSEVPIIVTAEIHSKGIYWSRDGRHEIYIKQSLSIKEKLSVLLHELSHDIHLRHYFENESRPEAECIANGAAFFICKKYGLNLYDFLTCASFLMMRMLLLVWMQRFRLWQDIF